MFFPFFSLGVALTLQYKQTKKRISFQLNVVKAQDLCQYLNFSDSEKHF